MSSSSKRNETKHNNLSSKNNRLSKTVSSSSNLLKSDNIATSSSSISLFSLRNGKVTSFNPRVNDSFPSFDSRGKTLMPILSLPAITSDPRVNKSINSQNFKEMLNADLEVKNIPARTLKTISPYERLYIKKYLQISDLILDEVIEYEFKDSHLSSDAENSISVFEKASLKNRHISINKAESSSFLSSNQNNDSFQNRHKLNNQKGMNVSILFKTSTKKM